MRGSIKKIIKDKGCGFIVPDDGSDEVEYQSRPGDKGPQAFEVKVR